MTTFPPKDGQIVELGAERLTREQELELTELLRAAAAPEPLDEDWHDAMLEALLSGASSATTSPEPAATDDQELLAQLACAVAPEPLAQARHDALLSALLGANADTTTPSEHKSEAAAGVELNAETAKPRRTASKPWAWSVVTTSVMAVAAATAFWFSRQPSAQLAASGASDAVAYAPAAPELTALPQAQQAHSTEALVLGRRTATERIDRIASVRAQELRESRYQAWGLR